MHVEKLVRSVWAVGVGILLASGCSEPETASLETQPTITVATAPVTPDDIAVDDITVDDSTVDQQDGAAASTTVLRSVPTRAPEGPSDCPTIGPERNDVVTGPVFLCRNDSLAGFGARSAPRPMVDSAQAALIAWAEGPTEQEASEGHLGWDLRNYPWFADALTVRREGSTLIMELDHWEPINNLSTTNGSIVFFTNLFATAFADPTVEEFDLSILGDNCPVFIGEFDFCFPITWEDVMEMNPSN